MNNLYLLDDFAQHFNFIYANTGSLKREAYQMRNPTADQMDGLSSNSSVGSIDQYDAYSHHLLLQHKDTKVFAASVRIIQPSENTSQQRLPIEQHCQTNIIAAGKRLSDLPKRSYSEMSRLRLNKHYLKMEGVFKDEDKLIQGLCLASLALTRILFHDYMFAELSVDLFKKLRSAGLSLEHASGLINNSEPKAIFYLDLGSDINSSSPIYELYQHILNEVAHQLNIPIIQDNDSLGSETNEAWTA
jgi:N-acyl amino acid synthase of PEP-CTERM/exosortase system